MKLLQIVVLTLSFVGCVRSNVFGRLDKSEDAPEQQAADALARGDGQAAEKILLEHVDPAISAALKSNSPQVLGAAMLEASDYQKTTILPLLATSYASKQKVEAIDILAAYAEIDDKKSDAEKMQSLQAILPKDAAGAEADIRKCRDLAVALVSSGANTDKGTVLTALSCTIADTGNTLNKVTSIQQNEKGNSKPVVNPSNADIDNLMHDMQVTVMLSEQMAKVDPKATKYGDSARKKLEGISQAPGNNQYEKFRNFMSK